MKNRFKDFLTIENAWLAFLVLLALGVVVFLFSGCSTPKQSAKKSTKLFTKALTKDRITTAVNCATAFPYKETNTTNVNTIYLPGETVTTHDTTTLKKDSIIYKYVNTVTHKTDTVRRDSIVYKDNDGGPMLAQAQGLLEQATKEKQDAIKAKDDAEAKEKTAKKARSTWMWIAIVEAVIIIGPSIIKRFI